MVLVAIVGSRKLVQARRKERNGLREDTQFASGVVLGAGPAGESNNSNDISTADIFVLLLEIPLGVLALAHDLDTHTLCPDIVEKKVLAAGSLGINSGADANLDILAKLALAERFVILQELSKVGGHIELVGIWVRVLGALELLDHLGSQLEVLSGVQFILVDLLLGRFNRRLLLGLAALLLTALHLRVVSL
jgi:hypothetical protein